MPHIIVEYSNNLREDFNIQALLKELHSSIDGKHNVTLDRIKTRAHKLENFVVGEHGAAGQMMHIELKLMPGRSDEAKTELSGLLLAVARNHVSLSVYPHSAVTVEVTELHGPSYRP